MIKNHPHSIFKMSISSANTDCSRHCGSDYIPSDDSEESALSAASTPPKSPHSRGESSKQGPLQAHIRRNYNLYILLIIFLLALLLSLEVMTHYIIQRNQGLLFQRNNQLLEVLPSADLPQAPSPAIDSRSKERGLKVEADKNKGPAVSPSKTHSLRSYGRHEQSEFTPPLIIETSAPQPTQTQTKLNINKETAGSFDNPTNSPTDSPINTPSPPQEAHPNTPENVQNWGQNSQPQQIIQNELLSNIKNSFFTSPLPPIDPQQSLYFPTEAPESFEIDHLRDNAAGQNNQFNQFPQEQISTDSSQEETPVREGVFQISDDFTGISLEQRDQTLNWLTLKDLDISKSNALADEERTYYESKYQVSAYPELPFCLVVPSYNNAEEGRHLKNMQSILMQEYRNFHIVFIDDASQDSTGDDIERLFLTQTVVERDRWVVIRNKQQKLAMTNLRMAALNYCRAQDIFMIVDGDDELVGRQVLKLFNSIFQREKVWFMYTNFVTPRGNVGFSRPIPLEVINSNTYRGHPFVTSHLRAFYTQLFRNIKQSDLRDEKGEYFRAANDVAICLPILQQAQNRVRYVPELTYYYNSNTGINNHMLRLSEQKGNDAKLRSRIPYKRLQNLFPNPPST